MEDEKISLKEFKTILPYLKRYRMRYGLGFFFLILVDGLQALMPQFSRGAIDLIATGDFRWAQVLPFCFAALGTMAAVAIGRFLWRYFIIGSSRRIEAELRQTLFDHLLKMSWDFFQRNKIGDLMARATNDIKAVQDAFGWGIVTFVDGTVMAAAILVIIFVQAPQAAAFAVLPLPLITAAILLFGKLMGKRFFRAQETYSAMSDTVQETFAGIRVVKSFVKEGYFINKFEKTNDDYRAANMSLVKLYGAFFPFVSFLAGLTTVILLLAGGRRVVLGLMTPGSLVAMLAYLQMLIWPLMGAGFMVNMIQRGAASMKRINEVLNTVPGIQSHSISHRGTEEDDAQRTQRGIPLGIEINNLNFSYNDTPVLKNINLTIPEGTVLGILGRTGSGKSTLLKTLMRMLDPPAGSVLVKGVDVREWDLAELRSLFGASPQDSYLFSDTIKNNIAYGVQGDAPPEAALEEAALLSALDRDLENFAAGWDTLIGERGLTLSGGQKQRVAIARAVIASPEILVLDDAFSAVDADTERRILSGILSARKGKTTIIVSHKVSTLSAADKVAVLEDGALSEYGTPAELVAAGRFFAQMAELQQLGEQIVTANHTNDANARGKSS